MLEWDSNNGRVIENKVTFYAISECWFCSEKVFSLMSQYRLRRTYDVGCVWIFSFFFFSFSYIKMHVDELSNSARIDRNEKLRTIIDARFFFFASLSGYGRRITFLGLRGRIFDGVLWRGTWIKKTWMFEMFSSKLEFFETEIIGAWSWNVQ